MTDEANDLLKKIREESLHIALCGVLVFSRLTKRP